MSLSPIFCSECGAQNVPGAKFCVTCGHVMYIPAADAPHSTINSPGTGLLPQDSLLNKRYRILKLAGTGGMGAVYKAEDTQFGDRPVAIKEMRQSSLSPQELEIATEQFKVEANMLARLQHPSLPRIYAHFLEGNRWYLVMDFIDGETLDERLRRTPGRKLAPPEVLDVGIQLCRVLDYLHKRHLPVVFRDLKPSNVMLTPERHLYLIDFGIARIFKPGQAKDTKAYGSIGYSAPEQFDREQTTAQADIYSLGITLHEMLSGNIPSLTPFHLPRLSFPGQPALERLAALIAQMIEMDKNKRPESMEKVRQELESIRDALKQALYIPSTMQSAAPSTQFTTQPPQEPGHLAPTEYIPPMAATVAVPSFTESAPRPIVASPPRRPAARPKLLTIGASPFIGTIIGVVIYALASLLFVLVFGLEAAQAQTSSSPVFNNVFSDLSGGPQLKDLILSLIFFLPFYFGVRFGPWVGLIVAVIGALPVDFLATSAPESYWFLGGSVALGFIPGLAFMKTRGVYKGTSRILLAVFLSFVAIVVWNLIRVVGTFLSHSIDFGVFIFALSATILVQLVALVPFVILLLIMNSVTKARAITNQ